MNGFLEWIQIKFGGLLLMPVMGRIFQYGCCNHVTTATISPHICRFCTLPSASHNQSYHRHHIGITYFRNATIGITYFRNPKGWLLCVQSFKLEKLTNQMLQILFLATERWHETHQCWLKSVTNSRRVCWRQDWSCWFMLAFRNAR